MRTIHYYRYAMFFKTGDDSCIHDQIFISKTETAFTDPYIMITCSHHFFNGILHCLGTYELSFFNIHYFSGQAGSMEQ